MHIAVLCQADSWYFRDLLRAAAGQHTLTAVDFSALRTTINQQAAFTCGKLDLLAVDAVIIRTMPPGSLEQVVFRMDLLARLEAAGVVVLNGPKAIEAAVDKYLTTAKLQAAGLQVPRTAVCQDWHEAMQAYESLGSDCVLKPLFGGEGRGIARLNEEALAARAFRLLDQLGSVIYLQEYIEHEGFDLRVLQIGDQAWGMRRRNANDWRTNISRGGIAEPLEVSEELRELATRSAAAVGAEIAGVDLLPDGRDGYYVLEVNAVPGWKALAEATGVDVADQVLRHVAEVVKKRKQLKLEG
jgi:ribosomal protein S6--L-glutamate ligase